MAKGSGKGAGSKSGGQKGRTNARGQGRKKTPTAMQQAKGNPGRRPLADEPDDASNVVKFPGGETPAEEPKRQRGRQGGQQQKRQVPVPEALADDTVAVQHWCELAPRLAERGVVRGTDKSGLVHLCKLEGDAARYRAILAVEGYLVSEPIVSRGEVTGYKRYAHPATIRLEATLKLLRSYYSEYGLTPSSRASLFSDVGGGDDVEGYLDSMSRGK